ncbi:NAD-dependent epimerase/dehydratase family protein [Halosquirtibacter xylanolyticus]|uniref:NAD-dependent epimerase/dehydratase family protein n=1 Tax=Halosquirtibacter xylanolyticus TaxID=3374599 RepID=UPI003747823D|nr:NAD-dependent epimerase/dehydratase family protein [Prolixibacteraceae bacterium]
MMKQKTIGISGASGFVGKHLCKELKSDYQIIRLKREDILYNPKNLDQTLRECDAVIHLSGASVAKRWSSQYKQTLWSSRIETTRNIRASLNRIALQDEKNRVFISTSAVGIYSPGGPFKEDEGIEGDRFLQKLGRAWEHEAMYPADPSIRTVIFRLSMVADPSYGAFSMMARLGQRGILMASIDPSLPYPMIPLEDLIRSYQWALSHETIRGVYNIALPEYISQEDVLDQLKERYGQRLRITAPKLPLTLAMGEGVSIITDLAYMDVSKWENTGFVYLYPTLASYVNKL